jgi:hypothetical protein
MKWGKEGARVRFVSSKEESVRRTAYITCLEHYRRAGVLVGYESSGCLSEPPGTWAVTVRRSAVALQAVNDPALRGHVDRSESVEMMLGRLSRLREMEAVPQRSDLQLD